MDKQDKQAITVVWPRDFLLPMVRSELELLLKYLARDDRWKGCFGVQVIAEGVVAKLGRRRDWKSLLQWHPEVTDDCVAGLVAETALAMGLAVSRGGMQMVLERSEEGAQHTGTS
jgi:hypothetical protein